jgi:hypothetical protein
MARVRVGSGQRFVRVAGFLLSAAVAALLTYHSLPSPARDRGPPALPASALALTGASALSPTVPPSAFTADTPTPLTHATSVTRWAPVLRATIARRAPSSDGAPIGTVATRTSDGTTNIVVASDEVDHHGILWERVGLAVLPNGTEGWIPRTALGGWSFVDTRLVVDRKRLTATLLLAGRTIFRARVAIGAPGTPTPAGRFYVRDRLSGFASPMYGPLAFGTNARSPTLTDWPGGGVVGIHGTDQPNLIPGRVSHGCVRLTNTAIAALGKLMPIGTAVTIK